MQASERKNAMHKHRRMVLLVLLILLSGMLPVAQPVTPVAAAPVDEVEVDDMQQTTLSSTSVAVSPIDEVESNDTAEEAQSLTAIGLERPVSAAIDVPGDNDWYAFDVVAERTYVVELYHVDSSLSARSRRYACFRPMYDTYAGLGMVVYDANGNRVTENCAPDGSGNVHAIMEFTSRSEGRFTLRVFPHESTVTGNYYLRILPKHGEPGAAWNAETFEPNNGLSNAYLLQPGLSNAVTSTIEARRPIYSTVYGDNDWYRIEAIAEHTYLVEIYNADSNLSSRSSRYNCFGRYSTYAGIGLAIYDTEGKVVEHRCTPNGGGNTHSSLQFTASATGVYYIWTRPHNATVDGEYGLRILPKHDEPGAQWDAATFEPNNGMSNAYLVEPGLSNAVTSTIEARRPIYSTTYADRDVYRFEAEAERTYVVELYNVASNLAARSARYNCFGDFGTYAGLLLAIYDAEGNVVAHRCQPSGSGNVHSILNFTSGSAGVYYIQIFPHNGSVDGEYGLRVLPGGQNDNATAWDIAFEPNNHWANAYPLEARPCGNVTTIEPRRPAFATNTNDVDWFAIEVEEGQNYVLDIFDIAPEFGTPGLTMDVYNAAGERVIREAGRDFQVTLRAAYTGFYNAVVYPNTDASGPYRIRAVPEDSEACPERPLPQVTVDGCASIGINPETGEVTVRDTPRAGCLQTFTRLVRCENGTAPQSVTLNIGSAAFPMESIGNDRYQVTIDTGTDLPRGRGPFGMSINRVCAGEAPDAGQITIGVFIFFDPSGIITDAQTGEPIKDAEVTLYRVPEAVPDSADQVGDCRTVETRNADDWNSLPAASIDAGVRTNPILDAIQGTQQISPTINPQITGSDGSYAWDVVEGCWYVVVAAEGYQTIVSPLVGVPPEVTDLDLTLTRADQRIYLPLTIR